MFDSKTPALFLTRYRFLLHLLFWSALVIYDVVVWGMVDGAYTEKFISSLTELPVKAAATYFTLYVLIDKFLIKKKYGAFIGLLLVSMAGFGIILRLIAYYILYPAFYPQGVIDMPLFFLPKILIAIFVMYSLVAVVASFHLIKHYYRHQQQTQLLRQTAQQLEKEKLAAELKLLKSQINPHFLFNTLNNLYALTMSNSAKAPLMVHKLSELMSYMLYDSNQADVPLEKEIQYLRNYIDLEKVRYGERLEVTFNIYGSVEGITIAPLLMLPFVENSFKHGARNQLHDSWIHIDLEIQPDSLVLKVENSKPDFQTDHQNVSGIGLNNLRKRLNHLYGDRYSLQLFNELDTHMAVLKLYTVNQGQRNANEIPVLS